MYGRTDLRTDGHVTITSLPKFLGLIAGGVRHGPQRVMGKNITDVHFTLDTME